MSPDEARLARAILAEAGPGELVAASSREWWSATFSGLHHRLGLLACAEVRDRIGHLMPDRLCVPGAMVADLRVIGSEAAADGLLVTVEATTVRPCRAARHGTRPPVFSFEGP
jgi:hypothetical protein